MKRKLLDFPLNVWIFHAIIGALILAYDTVNVMKNQQKPQASINTIKQNKRYLRIITSILLEIILFIHIYLSCSRATISPFKMKKKTTYKYKVDWKKRSWLLQHVRHVTMQSAKFQCMHISIAHHRERLFSPFPHDMKKFIRERLLRYSCKLRVERLMKLDRSFFRAIPPPALTDRFARGV